MGANLKKEGEKPRFNVLIIGAGKQGCFSDIPGGENSHKIISFGHATMEHPGFKLCGFYDTDGEKSVKAIETWTGSAYCCIQHAIELDGIDVAVVTTPDDTHHDILKQLAEHPLKLVICEKPICTDLQQARETVELYKKQGIPLMVDNTRNFIPYLRSLSEEHGKAISGYCLFNRGWLHSAIHAIGFFRMLNLESYKIKEAKELDFRVWVLNVCFEDGFVWSEERITDSMPVPEYYDLHMRHVIENAFAFLEGREPLIYTGEMALKDLEICFNLMQNNV